MTSAEAAKLARARLMAVAMRLFEQELLLNLPPPTCADRAWFQAHNDREYCRLSALAADLGREEDAAKKMR